MNTSFLAFIQNLRGPEIILIFLVVLLLFGAKRLPELAKSFGKSIKEFKRATSSIEDDIRTAMDDDKGPQSAPNTDTRRVEEPPAPAPASPPSETADTAERKL